MVDRVQLLRNVHCPDKIMRLHLILGLIAVCSLIGAVPAARADCTSDFNSINRVNVSAGPYSVEWRKFLYKAEDRRPDAPQRLSIVQVVPSQAMRIKSETTEIIVAEGSPGASNNGRRGWFKRDTDRSWAAMPAGDVDRIVKNVPLLAYFAAPNVNNVDCKDVQTVEGTPYLTFTLAGRKGGGREQTTAAFDLATYQPVSGVTIVDFGASRTQVEVTYRFDNTIKITLPGQLR